MAHAAVDQARVCGRGSVWRALQIYAWARAYWSDGDSINTTVRARDGFFEREGARGAWHTCGRI